MKIYKKSTEKGVRMLTNTLKMYYNKTQGKIRRGAA